MKYSRQREWIYEALKAQAQHPTAEMLYQQLKMDYPSLSLGTVYRNLNQLSERGEVARLPMPSGPDRFDGDTHPHYHMVCRHCGEVTDVEMAYLEQIDRMAQEGCGQRVLGHQITFLTECEACRKKQDL